MKTEISIIDLIVNETTMISIDNLAKSMSKCHSMIPEIYHNNVQMCTAIIIQATQWGMNPYGVASKTHVIKGNFAYEAQLINAVICNNSSIDGRFHFDYFGNWDKIAEKKPVFKMVNGKNRTVRGWSDFEEKGLAVRVGAKISGEDKITWGNKVFLSMVSIRNSGLWVTKPDQQLSYLAIKYWARLYAPSAMLGIYDKEETQEFTGESVEVEINPDFNKRNDIDRLNQIVSEAPKKEEKEIQIQDDDDNFLDEDVVDLSIEEVAILIKNIDSQESHDNAVIEFNKIASLGTYNSDEISCLQLLFNNGDNDESSINI